MAIYKLPKRFHPDFSCPNKQPLGPVEIDWGNPLTKGLVACWVFNKASGKVDLVRGFAPTATLGTEPQIAATNGKMGLVFGAASGGFQYGNILKVEAISIVAKFWDGGAPEPEGYICGKVQSAFYYDLRIHSGLEQMRTQIETGGSSISQYPPTSVLNGLGFMHNRWNHVSSRYANNIGIMTTSDGSNTTTGMPTFTTDNDPFMIGGRGDGASLTNTSLEFLYVYDRSITDGEDFSLRSDPYQILKPKTPAFYFTPSAAGGGVTVNLTGQLSTFSQGALTVTGAASVSLSGQSATFSQGAITVDISAAVTVNLAGQAATFSQGALSVLGFASVPLSGQASTFSQGSLAVTGEALVSLSGQQITANQGTIAVSVGGAVNVILSGQQIASSQGTITPTGEALVNLAGQEITSGQGTVTVSIVTTPTVINLSGQAIALNIGIIGLQTANVISLSGLGVTLSQGNLTVVAGGWTIQPDNPATWTQQSDESTTWTIQ